MRALRRLSKIPKSYQSASLSSSTSRYLISGQTLNRRNFSSGLRDQVTAILGAQWGDEGKGKLVDILATKYDVCARFNGGSNAGHTLVVDGQKFAMHLLPCGVLNKHCKNIIGNGVVVHVPTLVTELQQLLNADFDINGRILISDRAHIVFDFHQETDGILENLRDSQSKGGKKDKNGKNGNGKNGNGDKKDSASSEEEVKEDGEAGSIGTTRRGIGPAYASKMFRNGIRFGELKDFSKFKEKYLRLVEMNQILFSELSNYNTDEELKRFEQYRELLLPMIQDTILLINDEYKAGKRILLEGILFIICHYFRPFSLIKMLLLLFLTNIK